MRNYKFPGKPKKALQSIPKLPRAVQSSLEELKAAHINAAQSLMTEGDQTTNREKGRQTEKDRYKDGDFL